MTPLRQRMIEDMSLRGLAPTTQRSYIDYVAAFAAFFNTTPDKLDAEAIRQYELYLLEEKKLSPRASTPSFRPYNFITWSHSKCPGARSVFRASAGATNCRWCSARYLMMPRYEPYSGPRIA